MHALDFTNHGVVVTGGTRGIGAAIASAFLAAGARVLVCGRHEPASLPNAGDRLAEFVQADVRDPEQAAALVAAAVQRWGRLDVVVNNAGGAPPAMADTASPRLHAKIVELNLLAPLHVAQAANAAMRAQAGGGVILMVGSVSGVRPSPGTAAYGAAKAGLHHLATSLAMEWAPQVRVNTVVVGPVSTTGVATSAADSARDGLAAAGVDAAAVARTVAMGRPATPQDVAGACLLLASPLAGYVTGATLAVHGGGEWPGYLAHLRAPAYPAEK
jgi:NAD(P)-dependent dehydrogenase (short-subunit alcohol dehydrogenase family)